VEPKDFKILAPFSIKALTTPVHDVEMSGPGENEVLKIAGYANFSGCIENGDLFIDLAGDVVVPSGIDVSMWKSNPQIFLHHDHQMTAGRGTSVIKKADGLYIEAEIHKEALSEQDFYKIKSGLLCYFSIGFKGLKGEFKTVNGVEAFFITKSLLLEVSVVSIPCNSASSFQVVKSIDLGDGEYAFRGSAESEATKTAPVIEPELINKGDDTVKLTRKELLAPEVVEVMAAAGLQATLDEETEIELKDYVALLVKLEVAALAKAADETKQAQDIAAAEEAKVLADAQLANEVKAAEEAAHLIETETKAAMAALEESIATLTAKAEQL